MAKIRKITPKIVKQSVEPISQIIRDRAIAHGHSIEKFSTGEVNKITRFLNKDVIPDALNVLKKRLSKIKARGYDLGPATTKRLKKVIAEINEVMTSGLQFAGKELRKDLKEFAVTEAEYWDRLMKSKIGEPLGISITTPNVDQLHSIVTSRPFQGKVLSEWWQGVESSARNRISSSIRIGMAQGETIKQIQKRLVGTAARSFGDGDFAAIKRGAGSVARTAIRHINTQAREEVWLQNDDIIKGVQWISTLDFRTTDICASLDGRFFKLTEGPRPPMHFQCRSDVVPVVKSLEEMGLPKIKVNKVPGSTRASFNGQVPGKITYEQWLRKMNSQKSTRPLVTEALGPGRAKLWRAKKITVRDLTNDQFEPYTLKELQENVAKSA